MDDLLAIGLVAVISLLIWAMMNQRTKHLLAQANQDSLVSNAGLESQLKTEQELARRYEERESQREESMKASFKILSQEALDSLHQKADVEKKTAFGEATSSLSRTLESYMENINRIERETIQRNTKLETEIGKVAELGIELSEDTRNLTRALKADSQAQGAWGELVLENLLQSIGFQEGRDYDTQFSETSSDGKRLRTDFIIHLPDNRQVIIDSKVSLTAWERYINSEDEEETETALKAHCNSIKNHATNLSNKNYQDMKSVNTVEFVLMFVPLESAFGAAMRQNPDLYFDLSGNTRVKVVTGATIVTALMLIKDIWKRERQSRNQEKLIEEAGKLHDKIVLFLESFEKVGTELGQTKAVYDEAFERLSKGRGNVLRRTDILKQLGAKVKKELPISLKEEGELGHQQALLGYVTSGESDSEEE